MSALVLVFLMGMARAFLQAEGTILWTYKANDRDVNYASPTIARDGTIYVAPALTQNGPTKLTALSRDGQKKWDFEVEGIVLSAPAVAEDGTLYLGTTAYPNIDLLMERFICRTAGDFTLSIRMGFKSGNALDFLRTVAHLPPLC